MSNIVLGGGISGLSAAYYLSKAVKNGIQIYESTDRLGGWIKTARGKNGTLFELGPKTLRSGKVAENTLQLVDELGLTSKIRTSEASNIRMIYFNNQLITLPSSWTAFFKINPPFIRPFIFAIIKDLKTPQKVVEDESIYDFVARRFGKDYADVPLSALMCGIFGGDAKEISVKALLDDLFQKEQNHGSVIKGMLSFKNKPIKHEKKNGAVKIKSSVFSFANGLETLPAGIGACLEKKNVGIHLRKKCSKVTFSKGKAVVTVDGKEECADHVYSSLPSKDLANIVDDSFLKKELSSIPFVTVAVVNLEYEGDVLDKKGFGFLVPPNQNLPILGITFDSCVFPQEGRTVLTVMMGGRWFEKFFSQDTGDKQLLETAQEYVKRILKIEAEPSGSMVTIARDCIPQYIVGHTKRIENMREYISKKKLPLTLIGNSYDGVGLHHAILSAKTGLGVGVRHPHSDFYKEANEACQSLKPFEICDFDEEAFHHKPYPQFSCHVPGCDRTFQTVIEYESHYNSCHCHTCGECNKNLPNYHLLDLHISETHDYFFKELAKRNPMYKCFLEECKEVFKNAQDRRDHCITLHKFPNDFRFDSAKKKSKSKKKPKKKELEKMETDECFSESINEVETCSENKLEMSKGEFKGFSFGRNQSKRKPVFHNFSKDLINSLPKS